MTSVSEQHNLSGDDTSDSSTQHEPAARGSPKSWTQKDMDNALEALRKHNMSLTKVLRSLPSGSLRPKERLPTSAAAVRRRRRRTASRPPRCGSARTGWASTHPRRRAPPSRGATPTCARRCWRCAPAPSRPTRPAKPTVRRRPPAPRAAPRPLTPRRLQASPAAPCTRSRAARASAWPRPSTPRPRPGAAPTWTRRWPPSAAGPARCSGPPRSSAFPRVSPLTSSLLWPFAFAVDTNTTSIQISICLPMNRTE